MLKPESYVEYLEVVVTSLLEERNSENDLQCTKKTSDPSFKDCSFSIYNVEDQIKKQQRNRIVLKSMRYSK